MQELARELYEKTGSRVAVAKALRLSVNTVNSWARRFNWTGRAAPSAAPSNPPSVSTDFAPSAAPSKPTLFWCSTINLTDCHLINPATQEAACGAQKMRFGSWVLEAEPQRKCLRCVHHESRKE